MAQNRKKRKQDSARSSGSPGGFRSWHWVALLFVASLLLYSPALEGPFVLDDYDMIEGFSAVRTGQMGPIIRSGRPLLMLTFVANYRLAGGFEPFLFHITNVLLHALNAVLVWLFVRALFDRGGFSNRLASFRGLFVYGLPLLFLVSPIQTESVAYVSSRSGGARGIVLHRRVVGLRAHARPQPLVDGRRGYGLLRRRRTQQARQAHAAVRRPLARLPAALRLRIGAASRRVGPHTACSAWALSPASSWSCGRFYSRRRLASGWTGRSTCSRSSA